MLGIEGVTAPSHSTEISGDGERALQAGRSENALVAKACDPCAARLAVLRSGAPGVVGGNFLRREWRRCGWERLGGRSGFAGDVAFWDATFFYGKYRRSVVAIEDKTCLVALNHHRDIFSVVVQSCEQRRRGGVVIPEIVMDELESPGDFSGFC